MRLVIADDHVLLGQAVAGALSGQDNYDITLVSSLHELLSTLATRSFDVVMLDLKMPGMSGLPSVKSALAAAGDGHVVLFTGQVDSRFLSDCIRLGVRGCIPKDMPLKSLDSVLQLIASGQTFIPVKPDGSGAVTVGAESHDQLSEREMTILRLAADGMTNKEIARDVSATEVSVKMQMRSICKKLGARNRAHAAVISRERMLI